MPVVQSGSFNTTSILVANAYIQIVPPPPVINGVPSNGLGIVGTASWGPVNAPATAGDIGSATLLFGNPQNRKYDLMTAVWAAATQGANNLRLVRVTDGSDTAATSTISSTGTGLTLTARYTGTVGNQLQATIATGSKANTYKIVLSLPGFVPELFDNITQGITSGSVTVGTGYTSVPTISISAPQTTGGTPAQASVSLKVVSASVSGGGASAGTGYVTSDTITLANGVVLTVTASAGAITALAVTNPGSLGAGVTPTNPVPVISTSGVGTGALVNLVWGLGNLTINNKGSGYSSATASVVGGNGTGGSITLLATYWGNMADAINNGQSGLRGPSELVTAVAGGATGVPLAGNTTFSGGTDGASAVAGSSLLGSESTSGRSGMYALRASGVSVGMLTDVDDSTTWAAQQAFALSEGVYMIATGPLSDTITNAASVKAAAGIDSYGIKIMHGDWVYFNDPINNLVRLVSPQGFIAGRIANLSPEQSSLNKQIQGIVGTQRTYAKRVYSTAELTQLAQAGIDVITNPIPAGNQFGARNGHNSSSETALHGDNYTTMTNYLAKTLDSALGIFIGRLQSQRPDDEFRRNLKATVDDFFSGLVQQNMIDDFTTVCDLSNNTAARISAGYCQIDVRVRYLSVVEFLICNLQGGQTVQITRNTTPAV